MPKARRGSKAKSKIVNSRSLLKPKPKPPLRAPKPRKTRNV